MMALRLSQEWLSLLWRASWQAGCLYIVVAAIVFSLRLRLSPTWQFVLWSLVIGRLILVVTPQSPSSVFNLIDHRIAAWQSLESDLSKNASVIMKIDTSAISNSVSTNPHPEWIAKSNNPQFVPL